MTNAPTALQMEDEILARVEGRHPGGLSRAGATSTNSANDGRIGGDRAGAPASFDGRPMPAATAAHTQADVALSSEKQHVSLGDKIKGQAKIVAGSLKHDPNLAQEGEDLKAGDRDRLH